MSSACGPSAAFGGSGGNMHRRLITTSALAYILAVSACGGDGSNTKFAATLTGPNEVPAVTTNATGTATFTVSGTTVNYTITATGLSGSAAASHIHVGAPGVSGPIVLPFPASAISNGSNGSATISGSFTSADVTPQSNPPINNLDDLLAQMKAGNVYEHPYRCTPGRGDPRANFSTVSNLARNPVFIRTPIPASASRGARPPR